MSLRFRNRLKILPGIYLSLGKNGISTTIGPRGANINIGKKGVYLNTSIPGTGISNREKLLGVGNSDSNEPIDRITLPPIDSNINTNNTQETSTSDGLKGLKEHLEESRNQRQLLASEIKDIENILSELQSDLSKKKNGFFSLFSQKETIENLERAVNETTQTIDELKKEYEESKADINIRFDEELEEQYKKLSLSFIELINSKKIWDITTATVNTELKSSAKSIVERVEVKFKWDTLDFIKCDHSAFHLQNANGSNLFIYPAFVLLINSEGTITLIDLKELKFNFHEQRFNEQKETLPSDSKIIDYTWYRANKNGSRDLRFVGNYQIPVVNYGSLNFSSSNGLNETYYISDVEAAEKFANEFNKYLDLLNQDTAYNILKKRLETLTQDTAYKTNNLAGFTKQYYDLIADFSTQLISITNKLSGDETLLERLKVKVGETPVDKFISHCVLYDLYQILKIICKGKIDEGSLEVTGVVLLSSKLLGNIDLINTGFQSVAESYLLGLYKQTAKSIINVADISNPIGIEIKTQNSDENLFSNKIQSNLSLPPLLKLMNDPLFDEYATLLCHFANIIAKADITVSIEEEAILKEIYQLTHNPMPEQKNKSLNISEVSEKESLDKVLNELETLIGLEEVKQEVKSLINYIKIQREREKVGLKSSQVSYHCVFTGSPGTGKTTIARIVAKIYMHLGILKKGHLVETDRSGLVAEYLGQTAVKVNKTVDSAVDGVLFIDEAYSLVGENKDDFGKEAVATLIKRMEDDRNKLIVILAGYTEEMKNFIDTNPGLESRFNRYIEFKDFSPDELESIFKLQCSNLDYLLSEDAETKLREVITTAFTSRDKSFGNGRFVRNIFEKTLERQANRIASIPSLTKEILTTILIEDIPTD